MVLLRKKTFPFVWALFLSWVYILILACTSQMTLIYDARGFQDLGQLIHQKGWVAFFIIGPNREPLYPWLISLSLKLGQTFHISHISLLVILQISLIALSQFMLLKVLRRLQIRDVIAWPIVIYFGISPAILNSALSGYSEVVTYPVVLGIAWSILDGVQALFNKNPQKIFWISGRLGTFCFLLTLLKGTYEFISSAFLLLLAAGVLWGLSRRQRALASNLGICIISFAFFFYTPITGYKLFNKKYNGHFELTNRADQILYNAASLRSQKLTREHLLSGLASIPGQDFCLTILNPEKCYFWTTINLENVGYPPPIEAAMKQIPTEQIPHFLKSLAREKILSNPIQFLFLMNIDALKLFFWESTHVGFVEYPNWLKKYFDALWFQVFFQFAIFALSFTGFLYSLCFIWRSFQKSRPLIPQDPQIWALLLFLCLIILHVEIYAFCAATVPRHALALAPFYLILGGFFLDRFFAREKE